MLTSPDVHHLADVCWKKCITGSVSSGRLSGSEEACAQNCVERWMDTNIAVLKHLESMRGQ
jgi:import inner membrane translocase subunit TIM8